MTQPPPDGQGKTPPSVQAIPLSSLPAPDQALPVLSPDQTTGLCALDWNLVAVQPDDRNVVLVVPVSPRVVKGARIDETSDEVTVTVYGTPPPSPDTPVAQVSVHSTVLVQLPQPLGKRHLMRSDHRSCT